MKCCCCCPEATPETPEVRPPTIPGCLGIYLSGFEWTTGKENAPIPDAGPRPTKGESFSDPTYGTCLTRITDHSVEPPSGFARHNYSRRQAFNANNSKILINALDGFCHLYSGLTDEWLKQLPSFIGIDSEVQWSDSDDAILYYTDDGGGDYIAAYNVDTGIEIFRYEFAGRWPFAGATRAWTRGEGSPSRDQRYWCLQVENDANEFLGIMIFDRIANIIVASKTPANLGNLDRPDHCSMSITGDYCVVSWPNEIVSFDRSLNDRYVIGPKTEHSDLALNNINHDVFVWINYDTNDGDVIAFDLVTKTQKVLFSVYINGNSTALHVSGRCYNYEGWVIVSTYASGNNTEWLHKKIFAVSLDDPPTIIQLAHHQVVDNGYWSEPQATCDRGLKRILFASNWGANSNSDIDCYQITLPPRLILSRSQSANTIYNLPRPSLEGK